MKNKCTPFKKWGYMGTETAINGLMQWLFKNVRLSGDRHQQMMAGCDIIVTYGNKNIPDFKAKGHKELAADFIAKKIQRNERFEHFVHWVRENYSLKEKH